MCDLDLLECVHDEKPIKLCKVTGDVETVSKPLVRVLNRTMGHAQCYKSEIMTAFLASLPSCGLSSFLGCFFFPTTNMHFG